MMRKIGWGLEAALAFILWGLFAALPVALGSAIMGRLSRAVGPHLAVSNVARTNLRNALPDLDDRRIETIVADMWDNIGRVAAEFPHIDTLIRHHVEVVGAEHCHAQRDDGRPGLFISAHYGNWELAGAQVCHEGIPITLVYRAANNPWVEKLYQRGRTASAFGGQIPKGAQGARMALDVLRKGGHLGMLVDQKMNDGMAVPFFGRDAMTAPAVARMALKYRCPVVPTRVQRLQGCRFRITFYPPMDLPDSGNTQADTLELMTRINTILEGWIREAPAHWLWLHRRWPKDS